MRDFRDNKASKFEFKYRKSDPSKVKERANQSGGKFDQLFKDSIPTFSPKAGKDYKIRIMPPGWPDAESYNFELWVHYGVGADNQRYACLQKMKDEPCPICEEVNRMQRAGDEELANKLKAKKRQVPYIVDRDRQSEGPMIWPAPWTTDRDIAALCISKRTGAIIYLDDPDSGRDIEFDYVKKGDFPEMIGLKVDGQDSPLSDDPKELRNWLKFITENPIPDCVQYFPYDHIKKVLDGGKAGTDDDDSDEDKPRGITRSERQARDAKRTPADRERLEKDRKRHLEDDSIDKTRDELDNDEDDSLDDLDEPPKRKGSSKRQSLDEDEEADARPKRNGKRRDVEDDESDVPPRRSKASRSDSEDEDEAEPVSRRKTSQRLSDDDTDDESGEDDEPVRRRR